jgi:hypothetical protein
VLRSLRCVGAFIDPPPQPAPKTQPTTERMHLGTFLARCKGANFDTERQHCRTNHVRYTSRWKRGSGHSMPHVAAAVAGLCAHGDNVRSCILRLFTTSYSLFGENENDQARGGHCRIQAPGLSECRPGHGRKKCSQQIARDVSRAQHPPCRSANRRGVILRRAVPQNTVCWETALRAQNILTPSRHLGGLPSPSDTVPSASRQNPNALGGLVLAMGSNEPHNSSYPMRKGVLSQNICMYEPQSALAEVSISTYPVC